MSNVITSGDYTDAFNPVVYAQIKQKSHCLDVGCWTGNLGKALIERKKCVVDGLDVHKDVLAKAKKSGYRNTYQVNLNNDSSHLTRVKEKYDVIIFADVLEHLIDPVSILKEFRSCLKPDGTILISLPNVAFVLNRFLLLMGNWEYTEFGTLDKTHLRFYTISSLQKMVESAGYSVKTVKPYNQFGLLRFIAPLTVLFPSLLAYQIMLIAKK